MSDLRLHYFPKSGHAHRALVFAKLIGVPHQAVLVDLAKGEQHLPEFLALNPDGQVPQLGPDETARDAYAAWMQATHGERYGRDFSHLSTSESIDSIEYFLFPNSFFFPGLQFPMVYRFLPDPESIDHSYFELLMLRPRPTEGRAPDPPSVIELGVDDSYTLAEGLGALGRVYDQDTSNMAAQTRGFRASHKRGQTLGNYQEVRARHLQERVRGHVGAYPS